MIARPNPSGVPPVPVTFTGRNPESLVTDKTSDGVIMPIDTPVSPIFPEKQPSHRANGYRHPAWERVSEGRSQVTNRLTRVRNVRFWPSTDLSRMAPQGLGYGAAADYSLRRHVCKDFPQNNGGCPRSYGHEAGDLGKSRPSPGATGGHSCCLGTRSRTPTGAGSRTCCRGNPGSTAVSPGTTGGSSTRSSGSPAPGPPGPTCPSGWATGTASGAASTAGPRRAAGTRSGRPCATPTWTC